MRLVNNVASDLTCPFCQKEIWGNRCNNCFGSPIFTPHFRHKELTKQGYGFRAFESIMFWIPQDQFIYRISYFPKPHDEHVASLYAHATDRYETHILVTNIIVPELTPDNIKRLLDRYLKLKAFL